MIHYFRVSNTAGVSDKRYLDLGFTGKLLRPVRHGVAACKLNIYFFSFFLRYINSRVLVFIIISYFNSACKSEHCEASERWKNFFSKIHFLTLLHNFFRCGLDFGKLRLARDSGYKIEASPGCE